MAAKSNQQNQAPSVFDEKAALASLVNVKSAAEAKAEAFRQCIGFVTEARKKNVSWRDIATRIDELGGPKLSGNEVSALYKKEGRVDPAPRAARKAEKTKPFYALTPKPQTELA